MGIVRKASLLKGKAAALMVYQQQPPLSLLSFQGIICLEYLSSALRLQQMS